jgi:hypothetical protein
MSAAEKIRKKVQAGEQITPEDWAAFDAERLEGFGRQAEEGEDV